MNLGKKIIWLINKEIIKDRSDIKAEDLEYIMTNIQAVYVTFLILCIKCSKDREKQKESIKEMLNAINQKVINFPVDLYDDQTSFIA